jgi:hypothetical protein
MREVDPSLQLESTPVRNAVRRGDLAFVKSACKELVERKDALPLAVGGDSMRAWNTLHIACWGTARPERDREIIEQLLITASKCGHVQELTSARDKVDGKTALDLLKERRDNTKGADVRDIDLKKYLEKMMEWIEKGYEP